MCIQDVLSLWILWFENRDESEWTSYFFCKSRRVHMWTMSDEFYLFIYFYICLSSLFVPKLSLNSLFRFPYHIFFVPLIWAFVLSSVHGCRFTGLTSSSNILQSWIFCLEMFVSSTSSSVISFSSQTCHRVPLSACCHSCGTRGQTNRPPFFDAILYLFK